MWYNNENHSKHTEDTMKLLTSPFGSIGHALALTIEAARASGDNYIEIPYGEYDVYKEDCEIGRAHV